jgi:hypothetical protein
MASLVAAHSPKSCSVVQRRALAHAIGFLGTNAIFAALTLSVLPETELALPIAATLAVVGLALVGVGAWRISTLQQIAR